jgi:hypothetical protein
MRWQHRLQVRNSAGEKKDGEGNFEILKVIFKRKAYTLWI